MLKDFLKLHFPPDYLSKLEIIHPVIELKESHLLLKLGRKGSGLLVAHRNGKQGFYILAKPFLVAKSKLLPKISPLWRKRLVLKWPTCKAGDGKDTEAPKVAHGWRNQGGLPGGGRPL